MFVGRPFILARRQNHTHNAALQFAGTKRARSKQSHTQWDFLVQDCVAAAQEAINICHGLQTSSMGLARSSYTEYSSCRASLLVLIAYSICYRTNEFSDDLRVGLDAIREMASVGDSARSEVSLIETLESALRRLHDFDISPDFSGVTAAKDPAEGDYEGFANWYARMGTSAHSRVGSSVHNDVSDPGTSTHNQEYSSQPGPDADGTAANSVPDDVSIDSYPFDFNLLHMDPNAAFPTPNFSGIGEHDRELLEDLFWVPR